jgi:hypothetical protein
MVFRHIHHLRDSSASYDGQAAGAKSCEKERQDGHDDVEQNRGHDLCPNYRIPAAWRYT